MAPPKDDKDVVFIRNLAILWTAFSVVAAILHELWPERFPVSHDLHYVTIVTIVIYLCVLVSESLRIRIKGR